tara:strand:- start:611 stop:1312 length:702 start_codon:yes stop_codon:yes gene_type:complete
MSTNKKKIVFLASGNGGNFYFIFEAIKRKYLENFEIVEVIADRKCGAQLIAKKNNIKFSTIDFRESDQKFLLDHLLNINPDLIITTVHKILGPKVIDAFDKKLINLHYSLLPSFAGLIGMKPVERALESGSKYLGVTAHFAEKEVDQGKQIAQIYFSSKNRVTLNDEIKNLIFRCGCICLLAAIYKQFSHSRNNKEIKITLLGEECFLRGAYLPPVLKEIPEDLWKIVQDQAA